MENTKKGWINGEVLKEIPYSYESPHAWYEDFDEKFKKEFVPVLDDLVSKFANYYASGLVQNDDELYCGEEYLFRLIGEYASKQ